MPISERKMKIVIENYFKDECDVNTSIREAFEKGFRLGVKQGQLVNAEPSWIPVDVWLPKECGVDYLVTACINGNKDRCYIDIFTYLSEGKWWSLTGQYLRPGNTIEVLAWKEKPKPYGGDK